jgi:hypothetical protein
MLVSSPALAQLKTKQMEFLIYGFDYDWKSGGNQVLHDLAKILSQDYTTYVFGNKTMSHSKAICINVDKAMEIALKNNVITIYPEVISGNPFNATNVVRYVMYYPGWHAGDKEYNENEIVITYNHEFVKETKYDKSFILTVLNPKLDIMMNHDKKRDKIGLLVRKCKDFDYKMGVLRNHKHLIDLPILSIDDIINKCSDLIQLAEIYNTISTFISFDPHTYHSTMAALCGCTSVVIPSKEISSEEFYNVQKYGVAYGFENIDFSKLTHGKMIENLKQMEKDTFAQCADFVKLIKRHFIDKVN